MVPNLANEVAGATLRFIFEPKTELICPIQHKIWYYRNSKKKLVPRGILAACFWWSEISENRSFLLKF